MEVYKHIKKIESPTAVALGLFDGVHIAHQKVIDLACGEGMKKTVLTFSQKNKSPDGKNPDKEILTEDERIKQLGARGTDYAFIPCFEEISEMEAEEFFDEVLINKLNAKVISCGYDYHFGKGAKGDTSLLKKLCRKNKTQLHISDEVVVDGVSVSSTAIRKYIAEGNIPMVNKMLGYNYYISGRVVHGRSLGRTLGFPTANQKLPNGLVLPKFGVYKSEAVVDKVRYKAITNIGIKPTIDGEREPLAETFILGLDMDLYGRDITVELIEMTRPEQKFNSIDELKAAIDKDIKAR